jgi:cytosine deaminase
MSEFLNARLSDGRSVTITTESGHFAAFTESLPGAAVAPDARDLGDLLVLPALVDSHVHLDKTFLGLPWRPHQAGPSVKERILAERRGRAALELSVEDRALTMLEQALGHGTTALRCHVDIDPDSQLDHLNQVMAAREAFSGRVDVQLVAFPQSGLCITPGVRELMDAALSDGAEIVGGIDPIGIDEDLDGHLDAIFGLAEKHDAAIDIHLHDPGHQGALELRDIAARTLASGLGGRVMVSHAFALATVDDQTLALTLNTLAEAGVAIMTSAPGTGTMLPVARIRDAGVVICAGSDNVRDAWSPFGNADMLERAMLVAYRCGFRTDAGLAVALDMATETAAQAIGLGMWGLEIGAPADFIAVDAETVAEAVVNRPPRALVVKGGRVVAGTQA